MKRLGTIVLAVIVTGCGPAAFGPRVEVIETRNLAPGFFAVVVDLPEGADTDQLLQLAKRACGSEQRCRSAIWTDGSQAPSGLPMDLTALTTIALTYNANHHTGYEKVAWDCRRFPQPSSDACLAH